MVSFDKIKIWRSLCYKLYVFAFMVIMLIKMVILNIHKAKVPI